MYSIRILISFSLMFLFFTACSGDGGSGSSSSSAPITDGSGGGGDMIGVDPGDGGDGLPGDGSDSEDGGDDGDIADGDDTIDDGGEGDETDDGDSEDDVADDDDTQQACPIDPTPLKSFQASSNIISFANVKSTFVIASKDELTGSHGKLSYWNAATRDTNHRSYANSAERFKSTSFCFDGMTLGAAENDQVVCAFRSNPSYDRFLLFKISNRFSSFRAGIASTNPRINYGLPLHKLNATTLLQGHFTASGTSISADTERVIINTSVRDSDGLLGRSAPFAIPATITHDGITYSRFKSIAFGGGNDTSTFYRVASLYKNEVVNQYRLQIVNNNGSVQATYNSFSPQVSGYNFNTFILNTSELGRIYVFGENLKEIVVFNIGSGTSLTFRSHFTLPDNPRSNTHVVPIWDYLVTFSQNSETNQSFVSVIKLDVTNNLITEETTLENYFEAGIQYSDSIADSIASIPRYDLKKFSFQDSDGVYKSGIALKKDNALRLHQYRQCQ